MPKFVPVTRQTHGAKRWLNPSSYKFAAGEAAVPLVGPEVARAALALPLAFVKEGERYVLSALLSLTPGRNLFVGPDGRWLATYVPAQLRAYPFRLAHAKELGKLVLCVDEDSGLVTDAKEGEGNSFFNEAGEASDAVRPLVTLLTELERARKPTDDTVAALAEAGVIASWDIKVREQAGERSVGGVYRVDGAALNALSDEAFLKLRRCGSLMLAYAQLLSMAQMGLLAQLARAHDQAVQQAARAASTAPESLDSVFGLSPDDTVQFR